MRIRTVMGTVFLLLAVATPHRALAQLSSSTHFKVDVASGAGVFGTSTHYRLSSEIAHTPAGYSLGANNAAFSGFVRAIGFSPLDTLHYAGTGGQYTMISLPLTRADYAPTSVFSQLGAYNNTVWRLGHYDTATNKYVEPGTKMAEGLGYWLIYAQTYTNLRAIGLPQKDAPYGIPYLGVNHEYPLSLGPASAPGWNQMGNPFQYPTDANHVFVTDFSTFFGLVLNPSNPLTDHVLKVWSPSLGQYRDTTVINGRQGFWVHQISTNPSFLIFLQGSSALGSPSPALVAEDLGLPSSIVAIAANSSGSSVDPQWSVSITGREGDRVSEPVVMGAAAVESGAWNPLSRGIAPAPPGTELLTLRQTRTDWGRLSGDYLSVFQPQSDQMTWDFSVDGAAAPGELSLEVASQDLPAGTHLWLTDRVAGTRQELPSSGTVTVPAFASRREYRVEAMGATAQQPVANLGDGFLRAYPNPFRATAGLNFSLARGGDVSVDIFDLQGRRVRSLEARGLAAGEHVLVWDGRDGSGNPAGSGVYLTRWRAGELSGSGRLVKID